MPLGPGRYGARAEAMLHEVGASLVIVITIDGDKGPAFDVASTSPDQLAHLPSLLRTVADAVAMELEQPADISPQLLGMLTAQQLHDFRMALRLDQRAAARRRDLVCVKFCARRIAAIDRQLGNVTT